MIRLGVVTQSHDDELQTSEASISYVPGPATMWVMPPSCTAAASSLAEVTTAVPGGYGAVPGGYGGGSGGDGGVGGVGGGNGGSGGEIAQ